MHIMHWLQWLWHEAEDYVRDTLLLGLFYFSSFLGGRSALKAYKKGLQKAEPPATEPVESVTEE
jgi:hypothetical protein